MDKCRLCHSSSVEMVLDMGSMPHAGAFVRPEELSKEQAFPLQLFLCSECECTQIHEYIGPETLFRDYRYQSSSTYTLQDHMRGLASMVSVMAKGPKVLEVGCNDGILMRPLMERGMNVVGIDPATNIVARSPDLNIINDFFGLESAKKIWEEHGSFDVIVGTNVFAHINDLRGVMEGIDVLLAPDGLLVFEVHYLLDIVLGMQFDSIYHEHLFYHSLKPLERFLRMYDLRIIQSERVPIHGGSLRVCAKRGVNVNGWVGDRLLKEEERYLGKKNIDIFCRRTEEAKEDIRNTIKGIREAGSRIVGYGAAGRGNTLLNYCQIDHQVIDFMVDESPERVGRLTPGTHIPIKQVAEFRKYNPEYAFVTAWSYRDEVIAKEKEYIDRGGRMVFPLPSVEVIGDGYHE